MKKEYIKLPNIRGQKIRKKYYIASAVKHPAKADIPMMIWILKNFVKDGEIVLDPMAGIGGTLIEGMRLFPNSLFIGVELEERFVKWTNASIKKTEKIAKEDWFMKIGKAICVQGDARELGKIMRVDKIVSSPPWGGQVQHKTNYLGKQKRESGFEYSEDPENIGNKPHGEIDKIITSPPFGQAQSGGGIAKKGYTGNKHSPTDLVGERAYMPENVGEDKRNISNLPYLEKLIRQKKWNKYYKELAKLPERTYSSRKKLCQDLDKLHQDLDTGNLEQQTYLEAMFLVYQQCFKILRSEGLMILITKDFIRNQKRVRLGEDTIKLCKLAGFEHTHTYHREIKNPSFWRILYEQKYPSADKIKCEDIIILKK